MTLESSTSNLRAWVSVDLGALVRNATALARHARVPLLPMIKADGYGLGAIAIARALDSIGPWGFGVATVEEGIELRTADIRAGRNGGAPARILVFAPLLPRDLRACVQYGLTPTLGDAESIAAFARLSRERSGSGNEPGAPPASRWHLAVDTGMNRAGVPWNRLGLIADALRDVPPPEGVFTHYHSPERDDGSIAEQDRRLAEALNALPVPAGLVHTDNSAAIVRRTVQPHALIRPGAFLYGIGSGGVRDPGPRLRPERVVQVCARVVEVRDIGDGDTVSYGATWRASGARRIATVAVGYADGYRRHFSNVGTAVLNGHTVRVAGVVTMDMTMLDVTGVSCQPGDVATMIGDELDGAAAAAGVSPYELLTGLKLRLPRVYIPTVAAE